MKKRIRFRDVGAVHRAGKGRKDGWEQPVMKGYKMVCCDCGLVHTLDFRVLTDKQGKPHVQFRCKRDQRLTVRWRKQEGITVK